MWYRVRKEGFYHIGECIYNGKVIGTFKTFGYEKALDGIKAYMSCTTWVTKKL